MSFSQTLANLQQALKSQPCIDKRSSLHARAWVDAAYIVHHYPFLWTGTLCHALRLDHRHRLPDHRCRRVRHVFLFHALLQPFGLRIRLELISDLRRNAARPCNLRALRLANGMVRRPVRSPMYCGCRRIAVRPWHCPWSLHYGRLAALRPLRRLVRGRHGCSMGTARSPGFALVPCLTSRHNNRYRRPRQRVGNLFHGAAFWSSDHTAGMARRLYLAWGDRRQRHHPVGLVPDPRFGRGRRSALRRGATIQPEHYTGDAPAVDFRLRPVSAILADVP